MSREHWNRFGLGIGREGEDSSERRPRKPPAREGATWPKVCTRPKCPNPGAPVIRGRAVCEACAARIDARVRELRAQRERRAA